MAKQRMAKLTGVAPEQAEKRGVEGGAVDDADAAKEQGPQHALSWRVCDTILKYFNERLDTQGVEETDGQIKKLGRLLYSRL